MNYTILSYKDKNPSIDESVYIGNGAIIIGDVAIGKNSSIWFGSVLRGDVDYIKIGENTNIQDCSVIHTSRHDGPTIIGDNITIGHMALVHACAIKNNAFIGMRSVVMDGAVVEEYALLAAGSVVTNGKIVPSRELWAGVPAKFVRLLGDADLAFMANNAAHYVRLAKDYRQ